MGTNPQKPYWKDALITFGRMSAWVIGPILLALFLGKWLDGKFGTGSKLFFISTGVAFLVSTVGLLKEGRAYMKRMENTSQTTKPTDGDSN